MNRLLVIAVLLAAFPCCIEAGLFSKKTVESLARFLLDSVNESEKLKTEILRITGTLDDYRTLRRGFFKNVGTVISDIREVLGEDVLEELSDLMRDVAWMVSKLCDYIWEEFIDD